MLNVYFQNFWSPFVEKTISVELSKYGLNRVINWSELIKSYSPFSNSFELLDVDVRFVDKGIHFLEEKKKGNAILSLSFNNGEATYSCSTISYGVLFSYQLYGKGRLLEKRWMG